MFSELMFKKKRFHMRNPKKSSLCWKMEQRAGVLIVFGADSKNP